MTFRETDGQLVPVVKPYGFIPFPDKINRQPVPGHNHLKPDLFCGALTFYVRALTPVFVSSGQMALSEDVGLGAGIVVQAHHRLNGLPTIPASSLKGVVRSVVEAVSASCLGVSRRIDRRSLPDDFSRPCTRKAACPACTLFGMGGTHESYLGQVRFEDAPLREGQTELYRLPALHRPHPESLFYKDRNGRYKGRKFYKHSNPHPAERGGESEVIPPGSLLSGQITFTNLTKNQLGLLFYSLGMESRFHLKLGGGKPVGLGSLRVEPLQLVMYNGREAFLEGENEASERVWEGQDLMQQINGYITDAKQSGYILAPQAQELEKVWHFDKNDLEECPTGIY